MSTTQILYNSPALHSLKRDQLVKLCKIHALKASGKNKELIERLQLHAKILPLDDPLSIAVRSDNLDAKPAADSEDEASNHSAETHASMSNISRPSEQWDVVMDTITEVEEESLRSNRGASNRQVDEFGTNVSKASVTSSLRAIATSLGLRRNMSKTESASSSSSLSSKEVVQSSSTLPTSDPIGGSEEPLVQPVPGQSNLQGFPAPSGARLSLSQAPATTTIRLVSNPATDPEVLLSPPKLKPFATSFDLIPGTPGGTETSPVPVWPFSPGGVPRESLYPAIPTFEGFGDLKKKHKFPRYTQYENSDMDIDVDIPGGLTVPSICEPTPVKANANIRLNTGATPKSTEKPCAGPIDIFSPAPKPRDASIQDRSRLGIPRSEPFVFGSPLPQNNMSNLHFRSAAQSVLDEMNRRLAEHGVEAVDADVLSNRRTTNEESIEKQEGDGHVRVGDKFEKIHQREFDKMDSIASHYAAKRGAQSTTTQPILSKKRKSSLVVKERQSGAPAARHRPNGSRVVSGASVKILPGDFGEGDEDDDVADRRMSKRPRVEREESDVPAEPEKVPLAPPPDPEEEARKQKEREAIRRRLEHNKAKRRSSMGRPSLGLAPPPKPTRLGFFASAKSLVRNVWNRGAGSKSSSSIPVTKPVQPKEMKALSKTLNAKKTSVIPGSSGAPPIGSQTTKRVPSGGSSNSVQSSAAGRSTLAPPVVSGESGGTAASSRIWKSPNSSVATSPKLSTIASYGQPNNRGGSLVGFSSLGARTGPSANTAGISSMGAKSRTRAPAANLQKHTTTIPRLRTSSTLMAPTASSLAKATSHSRIPVSVVSHNENSTITKASVNAKQRLATSPQPSATLGQITNSPQSPAQTARPAKIFSQPFSPPLTRPAMSLTAAAMNIVGQVPREEKASLAVRPSVPVKDKVLAGRRPRISRSKVIARLASQRTAGSASASRTGAGGGKIRSSMGAQVAGKTRQSYGGARGGDLLMSAKKRVRQSEHVRRRAIASPRIGVD